jgi:hypothetical protein
MRWASSAPIPGTCASCSTLAARTPATLPKRTSSAFFFSATEAGDRVEARGDAPRSLRW